MASSQYSSWLKGMLASAVATGVAAIFDGRGFTKMMDQVLREARPLDDADEPESEEEVV